MYKKGLSLHMRLSPEDMERIEILMEALDRDNVPGLRRHTRGDAVRRRERDAPAGGAAPATS